MLGQGIRFMPHIRLLPDIPRKNDYTVVVIGDDVRCHEEAVSQIHRSRALALPSKRPPFPLSRRDMRRRRIVYDNSLRKRLS